MSKDKKGWIRIVGIGPGSRDMMTAAAQTAIADAEAVVGYVKYIELVDELIGDREVFSSGMMKEKDRIAKAVELAEAGKRVAVISSGDPGIYGMAGLTLEMLSDEQLSGYDIKIIPGISASNAAASLIGAPLMHDFCTISLSDLLTENELIRKRIKLAAEGDFTAVFYNPKSKKREDLLLYAREAFLEHRKADTPAAIVTNSYRDGQNIILCTIDTLTDHWDEIGMFSTVVFGNSNSFIRKGWFITPRGYEKKK